MIASGNTKTSDVVIQNGKEKSLPSKLRETRANYTDNRSEDENNNIEIIKFSQEVFPTKRWECLCCFESMFDVIVRNVEVGGEVIIEFWRF